MIGILLLVALGTYGFVFINRYMPSLLQLKLDLGLITLVGIGVVGSILLVVIVHALRSDTVAAREIQRFKRQFPEEDVGRTTGGTDVEGEELVEVDPEYVDTQPQKRTAAKPAQRTPAPGAGSSAATTAAAAPSGAVTTGGSMIVEYPHIDSARSKADGEFYADALVRVSEDLKVRIRTLVATGLDNSRGGGSAGAS